MDNARPIGSARNPFNFLAALPARRRHGLLAIAIAWIATSDLGGGCTGCSTRCIRDILSGWLFASMRGWTISYFLAIPLPMLASASASGVHAIDGWASMSPGDGSHFLLSRSHHAADAA
jgi:hypothetical protein